MCKNKYYVNRHYTDTDKIRLAVNRMNKDMRELSEYTEKLENKLKEIKDYIMTELITEYDIKYGGCVSGSDLPVEAITPILEIINGGDK